MMSEQVVVRIEHTRQLRYCARGIRAFFARHGLDYAVFVRDGIPADELLSATGGDAMASAAVEVARERR